MGGNYPIYCKVIVPSDLVNPSKTQNLTSKKPKFQSFGLRFKVQDVKILPMKNSYDYDAGVKRQQTKI